MPQVPRSFSAYPISVTLDGSGNGAISFQATGSNVRISNLSVRVSSSAAQAIATMYKNQIGDDYRLSGTNSGSTGDNVSIPVDLFDGESVIVVWTGGDPGATATATFSGKQLPFDEVGLGEGGTNWSSPIAAGDGSLIYPQIKSPNFATTLSGWLLDRDGNAEVNNVTVRGDVQVNGDSGSFIRIFNNGGQPSITLKPDAFTDPSVGSTSPAVILAVSDDSGLASNPGLTMSSPQFLAPGYDSAEIRLRGETWDGSSGPTIGLIGAVTATGTLSVLGAVSLSDALNVLGAVDMDSTLDVAGPITVAGRDSIKRRVHGGTAIANSAAIGNTETTVLTIPSFTYLANRAYVLEFSSLFNISAAPNRPQWRVRYPNLAGTQIKIAPLGAVSTGQELGEFSAKFNVGGSNVTTAMVITLQGSAAFNATLLAGVGQAAQVDIYDIGLATDNPNTVSL